MLGRSDTQRAGPALGICAGELTFLKATQRNGVWGVMLPGQGMPKNPGLATEKHWSDVSFKSLWSQCTHAVEPCVILGDYLLRITIFTCCNTIKKCIFLDFSAWSLCSIDIITPVLKPPGWIHFNFLPASASERTCEIPVKEQSRNSLILYVDLSSWQCNSSEPYSFSAFYFSLGTDCQLTPVYTRIIKLEISISWVFFPSCSFVPVEGYQLMSTVLLHCCSANPFPKLVCGILQVTY